MTIRCGYATRSGHTAALLILVILLLLAFVGPVTAAGSKQGGTLTVGVDLDFRGFDPLKAAYLQFGDRNVMAAVAERLFDLTDGGKPAPELALSAESSRDGTVWTITLRQGVFFHDGTPFNADAVVEHWQRMLTPKNRYSGAQYVEPIQSVSRGDDHTVRFSLKHPWPAFMSMISSRQWSGAYIPSPKAIRENTQNRAPVGTGPFMFKEWRPNEQLVLVKNPDYWHQAKPYLERIVFRPVPDAQRRLAEFTSGQTDLILTDRTADLSSRGKRFKVYHADASGPRAFILNTEAPPLDSPLLRQALAYAWSQERFLKSLADEAPPAWDPYGGRLACGNRYRNHDANRAKKLLAEFGKGVSLELLVSDTPRGREAGGAMRDQFREVGITLKLVPLPEADLVKRASSGDFQMAEWRLMDLADMGPYLNVCLHSRAPLNFSRYSNPQMDHLLDAQQSTANKLERQGALCGVAELINEDVIYLYGGGRRFSVIAQEGVQGVAAIEQGVIRLGEVWWETPAPKKKAKKRR